MENHLLQRLNKIDKIFLSFTPIISKRIAEDLELNIEEPYIEIILISKDLTFITKSKTFEAEKKVVS